MYPYQSPYGMSKQLAFFEKNYPPDYYWNMANNRFGPNSYSFYKPAYFNSQHFYNNSNNNEKTSEKAMPVASDYSMKNGAPGDSKDSLEQQDGKNNELKSLTASPSSSSALPPSALSHEPSALKPSISSLSSFVNQERAFKCSLCPKSFNQRINLSNHLRTHTGEKPYTCSFCFKTFSQRTTLKNHQRTHTGEKPYSCTECGKSFAQQTNLKNHERIHSGEKPFKCQVCGKGFSQVTNLRNHEWTHAEQKPFACSMCPKTFCQPTDLRNHERVHTGERPFSCATCLKTFSERTNLKIHQRTHTGEKPFQCIMCFKSFAQQTNLRNHERIHTGEKPFKCTLCSKAFSQVTNLRNHERTHSGDKPYKCLECQKAFSNKTNLKNHMRTHTGEKPFECRICYKSFSQQTNLENHIRTHSVAEVEAMTEQGRVYPKSYPPITTVAMRNKKQLYPQRMTFAGADIHSDCENTVEPNGRFNEGRENEVGLDKNDERTDKDVDRQVMSTSKQHSSNPAPKPFQMSEIQEMLNSSSALKALSTPFNGANFSLQELQQEFPPFISTPALMYPHVPPALINPLYLSQINQSWGNYNMPQNFSTSSKQGALEGEDNDDSTVVRSGEQSNDDVNSSSESGTLQEGRPRKQKEPSHLAVLSEEASKQKPHSESNTIEDVLPNKD